jgi:hypothetical protein
MSYVIPDEARPGALHNLVVRPSVPLLASMLAGAWLAWPWFAFNAIALGSPTRRRELLMCAAAFAGTAVLAVVLVALVRAGVVVGTTQIRLGLLAIASWKLLMSYWIELVQSRTFHVYEYYGGSVRDARAVLVFGTLARGAVLGLVDDPLWVIIVAGGL